MGFLQSQTIDISEIKTEAATEPSPIDIEEANEISQNQEEKRFITSPADIEIHRKINLQDADVSDEHQNIKQKINQNHGHSVWYICVSIMYHWYNIYIWVLV